MSLFPTGGACHAPTNQGSGTSSGSTGPRDWRKGSADIKLLLKNLYTQSPMPHTDVTFKFSNGIRIDAHKLILTLFSPVFEAEFFGSLNQDGEIFITDIEPEIFKMLLGYLYTSIPLDVKDKDFDCSKAWNLWYATEKYILPELSESCKLKIQQCVQNHDHYTLLNLVNAVKYHISDYITFHATEKVNKALESIINTAEWTQLEEYVFVHILSQENLSLTEGQLFQAIHTWCRAQCEEAPENVLKEAVRTKMSKFLDYIKWDNMSGEEFVEMVTDSDALSLEQYKVFSMKILKANFKGKRPMTREMANPLRVYRKAIPCPKALYIRGAGNELYDLETSPSPRPFHTFRFPLITVEVETTPQYVALKNEDAQNQLCIKFKTLLTPSGKLGRTQVFASVILENQNERIKSVFKRLKIADTLSLNTTCEPQLRYSAPPGPKNMIRSMTVGTSSVPLFCAEANYCPTAGSSRRTTPPIRQDMFLIPIQRLEDRKFGFLLRNKTISLNICIDIRDTFNVKVVREEHWACLEGSVQSEVVTIPKTSILIDLLGAIGNLLNVDQSFRLWWRSYSEKDGGMFSLVTNDGEPIWEQTDNFVPAIPTAFEQEPEITVYIEDLESANAQEPFSRILVFLKLYNPATGKLTDAGKIYPAANETEPLTFQFGLGFRNLVLNKVQVQDCKAVYLINRRTDTVEKLASQVDQNAPPAERAVMGENADICVVELNTEFVEGATVTSFDDFYDTLRNTKEITLKSKMDHQDYPTEFRLTLTLTTNYTALKRQVKQHLVSNGKVGPQGEKLSVDHVELYQCYWSPVSGLSPRSAEFPVDPHFDGNLEDLLKSGSREDPMIYFKAVTRLVSQDNAEAEGLEEMNAAPDGENGEVLVGEGILMGGLLMENEMVAEEGEMLQNQMDSIYEDESVEPAEKRAKIGGDEG